MRSSEGGLLLHVRHTWPNATHTNPFLNPLMMANNGWYLWFTRTPSICKHTDKHSIIKRASCQVHPMCMTTDQSRVPLERVTATEAYAWHGMVYRNILLEMWTCWLAPPTPPPISIDACSLVPWQTEASLAGHTPNREGKGVWWLRVQRRDAT